jgi:hypothetical protein
MARSGVIESAHLQFQVHPELLIDFEGYFLYEFLVAIELDLRR